MQMRDRFRGYLPIVVDIETGGFDPAAHAILELAAVQVDFADGLLVPTSSWRCAVAPYHGARIEPASLKVTGIDPQDQNRGALPEKEAIARLFKLVRTRMRQAQCQRAIMVAHNASFDQQFLKHAVERVAAKRDPFHPFTFIDTASLAAVAYGHTVLRDACRRAGIPFSANQAHDALYDAERTAELFCAIVNRSGFEPPVTSAGED
jgi:ribonuclease T